MSDTETQVPNATSYEASGDDIFAIIEKIEPALINKPIPNIIMACLSIVLTLMNPFLTPEELTVGIKSTSEFICSFMNTTAAAIELEQDKVVEQLELPLGN